LKGFEKHTCRFFTMAMAIILLACLHGMVDSYGQDISIETDDHYFYLNGEKFFMKGIGYEAGAIPGQFPWDREFNKDLIDFDMQRIRSGGFNCIRTWDALTGPELEVIGHWGVKVLMGIWIDPDADFSNEAFRAEAKRYVHSVLDYSASHDHIIGYLIHNEPLPDAVFSSGYNATTDLWKELIDLIHQRGELY
jgi:hypothetical protein